MCSFELSNIPIFKSLDKFHQTTLAITTFSIQLDTGEYLKRLESKEYSRILGLLDQKFNASRKIQLICGLKKVKVRNFWII